MGKIHSSLESGYPSNDTYMPYGDKAELYVKEYFKNLKQFNMQKCHRITSTFNAYIKRKTIELCNQRKTIKLCNQEAVHDEVEIDEIEAADGVDSDGSEFGNDTI